jgi:hypothetical protein
MQGSICKFLISLKSEVLDEVHARPYKNASMAPVTIVSGMNVPGSEISSVALNISFCSLFDLTGAMGFVPANTETTNLLPRDHLAGFLLP